MKKGISTAKDHFCDCPQGSNKIEWIWLQIFRAIHSDLEPDFIRRVLCHRLLRPSSIENEIVKVNNKLLA